MRINFHIHTNYSYDGYNSLRAIYKKAKEAKLDAIAITDHDTFEGVTKMKDWLERNGKTDLEIIPAEEITCLDGTHIIALYIKEHIEKAPPLEVCHAIKSQGGLVYFPHPSRKDGVLSSSWVDELIPLGDFFEVFNAKIDQSYNEEAVKQLHRFPNLLPLAGSDAHYNIDILKCYCQFSENVSSREALHHYKQNKALTIFGKIKKGSNNYFPLYYKYKELLSLPMFLRNIGKFIFPHIKNFRERNNTVKLELVYTTQNNG